jgi:hypothetical protein
MPIEEEKPGAVTPWLSVNQLLPADERFTVTSSCGSGYLLAPKCMSRLSALLYVLKEQNLAFHIGGAHHSDQSLVLSTRAFKQVEFLAEDIIAVEAGCDLRTLHATLLQEKKELAFDDWIGGSQKSSVASVMVRGCHSGLHLKGMTIQECLLGLEVAKLDGGLMRWGRQLPGAKPGPPLHKLIWGIKDLGAVIVKCYFKVNLVPLKRIWLSWSFKEHGVVWQKVKQLKQFVSSWERLDVIVPGNQAEKAFILAQISGTPREMELFAIDCPGFKEAEKKNQLPTIQNYLKQKFTHFSSISSQFYSLLPAEYLWCHVLDNKFWLATNRNIESIHAEKEPWKEYLQACLQAS